jgi:hypothetical protein
MIVEAITAFLVNLEWEDEDDDDCVGLVVERNRRD